MISLTEFRNHTFSLFKIMRDAKMELEIVYDGKVYAMSIRETDIKPHIRRPNRIKKPQQIRPVNTSVCEECGSLMFNGICMNTKCIHATGTLSEVVSQMQSQSPLEPK